MVVGLVILILILSLFIPFNRACLMLDEYDYLDFDNEIDEPDECYLCDGDDGDICCKNCKR